MNRNMGLVDRLLRAALAVVLLVLALGTPLLSSALLFWGTIVVALIFGVTALIGVCPLYRPFGIKTFGVR
ncbi:DUF2892 domain-containing protein [Pseudooceanicola sp. HF7]|uniref:YgaP family membrane protein n=1 Tax=Pseudooceanicola sp. HF7 TaxID=2721560 RepID=UPI00143098A3|nr:DUF2892 domain-containing protein [Pseudooceanicola sp. HF7]NIZ09916.1 DUF2892 domain-containing protein [Pseudooceanicola sp. HF7]